MTYEHLKMPNHQIYRQNIIESPQKEKVSVNNEKRIFIHFTYCSRMR